MNTASSTSAPMCGLNVSSAAATATTSGFSWRSAYSISDAPSSTGKPYCPTYRLPTTGTKTTASAAAASRPSGDQPSVSSHDEAMTSSSEMPSQTRTAAAIGSQASHTVDSAYHGGYGKGST